MAIKGITKLSAAGKAALKGSPEPVGSVCKPCEAKEKKIPIVFVPGVMGSRLTFTAIDESWDPDSTWAMIHWLRISAARSRDELRHSTPAVVMTSGNDLSPDELKHGYGGMAMDFYVPFLRFLRSQSFKLGVATPVYAVGYDWRQSNKTSGAYVAKEIDRILAAEGASQIILLSHSMGGMVTRSAMKDGLAGKVIGVVHIFQPVDGAPVLYRRFFTGAQSSIDGGFGLSTILGNTPEKFATVSSGMPGPLQLLPTNKYRDTGGAQWLRYKQGGVTASWAGDVYELYVGSAAPPALMNFASPPRGVSAAAAADLKANVLKASSFHATLGHYQHPKTRTIHSTGLDTDMAVVFDPPTQPGPQLQTIYTEFGPVHFNAPPEWKHKGATRVHRAEGDGTVPGPSANPLTPNVAVSGVEHSAACSDVNVQRRIRKWIEELLS